LVLFEGKFFTTKTPSSPRKIPVRDFLGVLGALVVNSWRD
jgi:hypothetical protein